MPAPSIPTTARFLRAFPLKTFVVVSALCLVLREEFPFSHFPMYSSFANYTYYVYVAGSNGEPIPLESITSVRTSALKKIYQDKLDDFKAEYKAVHDGDWPGFRTMTPESRRPAGQHALDWLIENCKEHARPTLLAHAPLILHQVELYLDEDTKAVIRADEPIARSSPVSDPVPAPAVPPGR